MGFDFDFVQKNSISSDAIFVSAAAVLCCAMLSYLRGASAAEKYVCVAVASDKERSGAVSEAIVI